MTKKEFCDKEKLYHYTNLDSALRIIESNTILFNHLSNMNDINELYRPLFYDNVTEEIETLAKAEMAKYQQISLTRDFCRMGFDIPAMWGHYGDNGKGVCFIFDKKKLIDSIPKTVYHDKVEYVSQNHSFSVYFETKEEKIVPFKNEDIKDFFFKKTCDWSYEQEYRLLIHTDDKCRCKLPLNDAIIALVMRNAREYSENNNGEMSLDYKLLRKIADPQIDILEYDSFCERRHLQIPKPGEKLSNEVWNSTGEFILDIATRI